MKSLYSGIFLLLLALSPSYGLDTFAKGPLQGKTMYAPYLIYYGFNGVSARSGRQFELDVHFSQYYIQDFSWGAVNPSNYQFIKEGIRYYDTNDLLRDYESLATEIGAGFFITPKLEAGFDFRFYGFYSGFLDQVIEGFHHAFGFPNGGREAFFQNRIFLSIPNYNGVRLYLDHDTFAVGDLDLWVKWVVWENQRFSFALLGAFKIPTGSRLNMGGSGYPDIGLNVMLDIRPLRYLSFYFQSGVVLPFDGIFPVFDSHPFPFYIGMIGLELHPFRFFSLNAQLSIKSMPVRIDDKIRFGWDQSIPQGDLPQTNLSVGFKVYWKDNLWQFYFEEDTFTNQGADITINLLYSRKIRFR